MLQIRDKERQTILSIEPDGSPVILIDDIELFLGFNDKLYEIYHWQYAGAKGYDYEESKRFEMVFPLWKDILQPL